MIQVGLQRLSHNDGNGPIPHHLSYGGGCRMPRGAIKCIDPRRNTSGEGDNLDIH